MIFLHGKGKKPNEVLFNPLQDIAKSFDADLIPIAAQFKHRDGYRWHNINKQPETISEFNQSLDYIDSEAKKILSTRKQNWNDIIWIGYSQGADIAVRMALSHGAKRLITISGDILEKIPLPEKQKTNFVTDWIEAGIDNVLKPERKESYKKLQSMGIQVNYIISADSKHFYIKETDTIIENIDIKDYMSFLKSIQR